MEVVGSRAKGHVKSVLVVEDDPATLFACVEDLGAEREVFTATSVPGAMVFLRRDELDLVIIDERLGAGRLLGAGLQLLGDFKQVRPDLPVVLVSAIMTRTTERLAYELGADAVFEKSTDELARAWIPTAAILACIEQDAEAPGLDPVELRKLERVERDHIIDTLMETKGNISAAARLLGIERRTLQKKVRSLGIVE